MAMERSSSLDLESLKEGGGDHWHGEWEAEMVLAIAGPSPSCSRSPPRRVGGNRSVDLPTKPRDLFFCKEARFPQSAPPRFTHYFTINPIRICNTAGTTCAPTPFFTDETYKIYFQVGVAPIVLPIKQINNTSLLTVNGVANVSVPGNGQHPNPTPNPTTINA
jgi:hypothetical protein